MSNMSLWATCHWEQHVFVSHMSWCVSCLSVEHILGCNMSRYATYLDVQYLYCLSVQYSRHLLCATFRTFLCVTSLSSLCATSLWATCIQLYVQHADSFMCNMLTSLCATCWQFYVQHADFFVCIWHLLCATYLTTLCKRCLMYLCANIWNVLFPLLWWLFNNTAFCGGIWILSNS